MKPVPEEWESLRLAAKAADRERAGEMLRPEFERRLAELGYGPRAVAHAFSVLTGPGTVAEALAELTDTEREDRSKAIPLAFETVEAHPDLPAGHALTIVGVEREPYGIRIRYAVDPPLPPHIRAPQVEARDDRGESYHGLAGAIGLPQPAGRAAGFLTLPLPRPPASLLRVRISCAPNLASVWERPAYEIHITL